MRLFGIKCPSCGMRNKRRSSFCVFCAAKLRGKRRHCWVKKSDSYDCGKRTCPGMRLIVEEAAKAKAVKA